MSQRSCQQIFKNCLTSRLSIIIDSTNGKAGYRDRHIWEDDGSTNVFVLLESNVDKKQTMADRLSEIAFQINGMALTKKGGQKEVHLL